MSSPLSMLGKNRRIPLTGVCSQRRREVPFEGTLYTENSTSRPKATQKTNNNHGSGLSDMALMSTMMKKLGELECKVHDQTLEIQRKENKIAVLEEKLRLLQKSKADGQELAGSKQEEDLERECVKLQEQVFEMEQFLNDYGMVWVGSGKAGDPGNRQEEQANEKQDIYWRPTTWHPGVAVPGEFRVNFDLVLQNIQDLNGLAGDGECHVEVTPGGGRLTHRTLLPTVPLTLYSNGMVMFEGPFRSFQEPSTQQCIVDLMDGYFPSELQKRFPDGVTFQVTDRRDEAFYENPKWSRFPGEGCSVGSTMENALGDAVSVSGKGKLDLFSKIPVSLHPPPSHSPTGEHSRTQRFLNRLPKRVVRAGKVIDIRDAVRFHLQAPSDTPSIPAVTIVETPTQRALNQRSFAPHGVTTLRVRSEDGEHTFLLKMLSSDTIGQLRTYLDTHRNLHNASYDIMSFFPRCCYVDDQTLADCGLTRNATLLLRTRPRPQ